MTASSEGLFITIEGIDGSGKSTQSERLCQWLEDVLGPGRVLRTFEPGGWSGGELLRRLLLGGTTLTSRTELLLFLADRSGHLDKEILPALAQGRWVVCERYTDSTLAYQSWGRGIAYEKIKGLLDWCGFPEPDGTILLDVNEETAWSRLKRRGEADRMESGGADFMARVVKGYRELARRDSNRIMVLDGTASAEHVAERLCLRVEERFGKRMRF
ncbi:MAG: dTMP kinase [Synergistaceae bacterium]|jgi:dTMP kinase|nr:dTMP kinase [Synergistaceae bacterium]